MGEWNTWRLARFTSMNVVVDDSEEGDEVVV